MEAASEQRGWCTSMLHQRLTLDLYVEARCTKSRNETRARMRGMKQRIRTRPEYVSPRHQMVAAPLVPGLIPKNTFVDSLSGKQPNESCTHSNLEFNSQFWTLSVHAQGRRVAAVL